MSALLIAIVDDEEPVRRAFGRLLRSAGLKVENYADGLAFLDSLKDHQPHCLILDLQMPVMSGFDLLARLREQNVLIPTVIVTGNELPGARERALESGASAFLRKPVDDESLLGAISAAVTRARQD